MAAATTGRHHCAMVRGARNQPTSSCDLLAWGPPVALQGGEECSGTRQPTVISLCCLSNRLPAAHLEFALPRGSSPFLQEPQSRGASLSLTSLLQTIAFFFPFSADLILCGGEEDPQCGSTDLIHSSLLPDHKWSGACLYNVATLGVG